MNRAIFGAVAALLMVAAGLFWWQGRAETERGAPPPDISLPEPSESESAELLPTEAGKGLAGAALPEVDEATREEKRFNRLDRDRDNLITRAEMLATRVAAFRKLDRDGNNLLSFEEWSVTSSNRFKAADANGDARLSRTEYATTKPKVKAAPKCRC